MVVVNVDTAPMQAAMTEVKGRFKEVVAQNFADAGRQIVDLFRDEWLSGRGAGSLGLNIVTGNLWQSVRSATTVKPNAVVSEVFNRGADYWFYHENPEGGRHQFLYLGEAFETDGGPIYEDAIDHALRSVA